LSYFPFSSKLAHMRFGLFVNVKRTEVAATRGFVERNVGCGTMFPVLSKGA
jgi:hypothetical protein